MERFCLYFAVFIWSIVLFLTFENRIQAGEANYEAGQLAVESLRIEE